MVYGSCNHQDTQASMIKVITHEIEPITEELHTEHHILGVWIKSICHRIVFSTDEELIPGQTLVVDDTPVTVVSYDGFYYTAEAVI